MELTDLERTWAALGEVDPLWAVLSNPQFKDGKWDVQEFFATGEAEIDGTMTQLAALGLSPERATCLEFGCGVGRCSGPLAQRFREYHGVDISSSMLDLARRCHDGPEFHFHHNNRNDLAIFDDATFDFIYSRIVLQHIPPEHSLRYIAEFVRVLRPGGLAVFQLPAGVREWEMTDHRAEIELLSGPDVVAHDGDPPATKETPGTGTVAPLRPGTVYACTVRIVNPSIVTWPREGVLVGNHWLDERGGMVQLDDGRAVLPRDMPTGDDAVVSLHVTTPTRPRQYQLEIDLVQEGVTWFAGAGSAPVRQGVVVSESIRERARRLAGRLRARALPGRSEGGELSEARPAQPAYDMHTAPRDEVVAVVSNHGGRVVEVADDGSCGARWVSYLYVVTKP